MSIGIHFHSPRGGLMLKPASVEKLFKAMGWDDVDVAVGTKSLIEARVGLEKAKMSLRGRDLDIAIAFEQVIDELSDAGEESVEWA